MVSSCCPDSASSVVLTIRKLYQETIIWYHKLDDFDDGSQTLYVVLKLFDELDVSDNEDDTQTVQAVKLCLERCPQAWIESIDWTLFAQLVASFAHLDCITVRVKSTSAGMALYTHNVQQHLETLSQQRGVKLVVEEVDGS